MSYPKELDEYDDKTITREYLRRRHCKGQHECYYCGKRLDSGHPCKLNEHSTPFPAHVATEAVMQMVAATIDDMIPSGRGFALVITHTTEGPEGSFGTYVSNLVAEEVPALLRGTADYIEDRERQRGTFFENAPETPGPCIHCGHGMSDHTQDPVSPTRFACPPKENPSMSNYVVTFTHPDQEMHIRAANKVERQPDSRPDPNTSVWDFGEDELPAQQAEARLRGDVPGICFEQHATEVSSGAAPVGGDVGGEASAASEEPASEPASEPAPAAQEGGANPNPNG